MRKRRKLINITKERREEREKKRKKSVEKRVRGKMWWKKCGGKGHILHDPPLRNLGLLVQHVEPRAKKKNPKGKKF